MIHEILLGCSLYCVKSDIMNRRCGLDEGQLIAVTDYNGGFAIYKDVFSGNDVWSDCCYSIPLRTPYICKIKTEIGMLKKDNESYGILKKYNETCKIKEGHLYLVGNGSEDDEILVLSKARNGELFRICHYHDTGYTESQVKKGIGFLDIPFRVVKELDRI